MSEVRATAARAAQAATAIQRRGSRWPRPIVVANSHMASASTSATIAVQRWPPTSTTPTRIGTATRPVATRRASGDPRSRPNPNGAGVSWPGITSQRPFPLRAPAWDCVVAPPLPLSPLPLVRLSPPGAGGRAPYLRTRPA